MPCCQQASATHIKETGIRSASTSVHMYNKLSRRVLTKQSRGRRRGGVGQAVDGVLDSEGQATKRQNALTRSSLGVDGSRLLQDLLRQQWRLCQRGMQWRESGCSSNRHVSQTGPRVQGRTRHKL